MGEAGVKSWPDDPQAHRTLGQRPRLPSSSLWLRGAVRLASQAGSSRRLAIFYWPPNRPFNILNRRVDLWWRQQKCKSHFAQIFLLMWRVWVGVRSSRGRMKGRFRIVGDEAGRPAATFVGGSHAAFPIQSCGTLRHTDLTSAL